MEAAHAALFWSQAFRCATVTSVTAASGQSRQSSRAGCPPASCRWCAGFRIPPASARPRPWRHNSLRKTSIVRRRTGAEPSNGPKKSLAIACVLKPGLTGGAFFLSPLSLSSLLSFSLPLSLSPSPRGGGAGGGVLGWLSEMPGRCEKCAAMDHSTTSIPMGAWSKSTPRLTPPSTAVKARDTSTCERKPRIFPAVTSAVAGRRPSPGAPRAPSSPATPVLLLWLRADSQRQFELWRSLPRFGPPPPL